MFEEDESDNIEGVNFELGQDDIVSQTAWDTDVQELFENNKSWEANMWMIILRSLLMVLLRGVSTEMPVLMRLSNKLGMFYITVYVFGMWTVRFFSLKWYVFEDIWLL